MSKLNLTGQRFSRLVVLEDTGKRQHGKVVWLCKCDCGKFTEALSASLRSGNTKSCICSRGGMLQGRKYKGKNNPHYKHGSCVNGRTRLVGIYYGMRNRCYYRGSMGYKYYGGRGITICDEWLDSFTVFRDFALNNGYKNGLTIHRREKDVGYCPENCEFITRSDHSKKSNEERK